MTIFYFYAISFMALSGVGIVFLNAESILAACFFIFFALIVRNADSAVEGLDMTRQGVRKQLAECMYETQSEYITQLLDRREEKKRLCDNMYNNVNALDLKSGLAVGSRGG